MAEPDAKYVPTFIPDAWEKMKDWPAEERELGWMFVGPCPRCGHEMSKFFRDDVDVLTVEADLDKDIARCNCNAPHEDRPAEKTGCGAYWGMHVKRGLAQGPEGTAAADPANQ